MFRRRRELDEIWEMIDNLNTCINKARLDHKKDQERVGVLESRIKSIEDTVGLRQTSFGILATNLFEEFNMFGNGMPKKPKTLWETVEGILDKLGLEVKQSTAENKVVKKKIVKKGKK